jgi:predicted flap endonuclease-1-like 5' DNA nuclease
MPQIQCLLGPTNQTVFGATYVFERDHKNRFVATIYNQDHADCFLARSDVYQLVKDDPEPARARVTPQVEPAEPVPPTVPPIEPVNPAVPETPADKVDQSPPEFEDDVLRIKGIGPAMKEKLKDKGITSLVQIASFTGEQIATLDSELRLRGAIDRDGWVEQAKTMLPIGMLETAGVQPAG